MAEVRNILFTFDYELFLGRKSGSADKCVIEPTDKIIKILSAYGAKGIFFIDTAWLIRLKEVSVNNHKAKNDYKKVADQLQNLLRQGHYVFNHLHPHWINAKYLVDDNQWDLDDQTHYRFSSLSNTARWQLFTQTTQILKEISDPIDPAYKSDGYRAGGWSIQPFSDFMPYFGQFGIKYEFSVMPGAKSITTSQHYDFTKATREEPYTFSSEPTEPAGNGFTEFPISHIEIGPIIGFCNKVLLKILHWRGIKSSGDGLSVSSRIIDSARKGEMLSIDLLTSVKLPSYLKHLRSHNYMHFISHPKMLTEHNLSTFDKFMKKAFSEFTIESDFRKMAVK
jgi:hypothetical protein